MRDPRESKVFKVSEAISGQKVIPAVKDPKGILDPRDQWEIPDLQALRARKAILAPRGQEASPGFPGPPDPLDLQVLRALLDPRGQIGRAHV